MSIIDDVVKNIKESGTIDPKLLRFVEEKKAVLAGVTTPEIYQQIKKKPGRKRKRGPRKKGKELPVIDERWGSKQAVVVNECLPAIVDYIQVSDALYSVAHDCQEHGDKKACEAFPFVSKDYKLKKKEVKKKCKINR